MVNLPRNLTNPIVIGNALTCTILILIAIAMDFTNRRILKKKEDTQQNRNRSRSVSKASQDRTQNREELLLYFTNITLFLFFCHTVSKSLVRIDIHQNNDYYCKWWAKANVVMYHVARCSLFFILVFRVHIIFKGSCYEYKKYIIYPLYTFILLFTVYVIIMDILVIGGRWRDDIDACSPIYPLWGIIQSGATDFFLSITTLILFIMPLVKLKRLQHVEQSINITSSNSTGSVPIELRAQHSGPSVSNIASATPTVDNNEASPSPPPTPRPLRTGTSSNPPSRPSSPRQRGRSRKSTTSRPDGLSHLIVRYALLVIIAIGSTLISYVTAFLGNWMTDISSPIDNAINVWCIVLINGVNQKVYKKLCGICHSGIKQCIRD